MISPDERQRRIQQIEDENKALRNLNNFAELKERIKNEPSLLDQVGIDEDVTEQHPFKKIANPAADSSI